MVTLGISTNTRLVSVAIFSQNQLIDYFTHLHKASWSPAKADQIVASLEPCVRKYSIKGVALSIPHVHYTTKEHRHLLETIQRFFKTKKIEVRSYFPASLETFIPKGTKKTKKALMNALVQIFPELTICYNKELRNKGKYYHKLFEAVAIAALLHSNPTAL